jgi:hypothetical protein
MHTNQWSIELGIAVNIGGGTGESRIKRVAGLDEALASRDLASQRSAFRALRIVIDGEWPFAGIVWDGCHLNVRIRGSICKDNRCKVDMLNSRCGCYCELLVCLVYDLGDIRSICPTITFRSQVERLGRVLRKAIIEEFEESMDIFTGGRATTDSCTIISIGITNVHRLIKEEDVGVCVPTEGIVSCVVPFIGDMTRSKFKQ